VLFFPDHNLIGAGHDQHRKLLARDRRDIPIYHLRYLLARLMEVVHGAVTVVCVSQDFEVGAVYV